MANRNFKENSEGGKGDGAVLNGIFGPSQLGTYLIVLSD